MRKSILRVIVPICSIVVALAAAEIGLRAYYLATFSGGLDDLALNTMPEKGAVVRLKGILDVSPYPLLVYQLKPNLDVQFIGANLKTNNQGWRETTLPEPKAANEYRIVGIGDSVMFGWGVAEELRYMDLLETRLQESSPDRRWTTISLAVPGYNLAMEMEALRQYGLAYEPDMIIYGFVSNDFCAPTFLAGPKSILTPRSFIGHYLYGSPLTKPTRMDRRGRRAGASRGRGRDSYRKIRAIFPTPICSPDDVPTQYRQLVGIQSFGRAVRELAQIGRDLGIPVLVLTHRSSNSERLPELLPDDVTYLDFTAHHTDYMRAQGNDDLLQSELILSPRDPHPSVKGHQLIARHLFDALRGSGLLPSSPSPQ